MSVYAQPYASVLHFPDGHSKAHATMHQKCMLCSALHFPICGKSQLFILRFSNSILPNDELLMPFHINCELKLSGEYF